jgi:transmembrane sensor
MTLDTNTRVETRISASRREVRIISGGAFFDVAPRPDLPFVVTDNHFRVDAGQASFFVGTTPRPQVIVAAGDLDLRSAAENGMVHRLGPGKFAYRAPNGRDIVTTVTDDVIARRLAWREGGISLDGESVFEAAARFNRYNDRQIVIDDASLARQEVVGWFKIDQPDLFAQTVASAFRGEVSSDGKVIKIVPRKKA